MMDGEGDDNAMMYQCKLCDCRFKTTADLQKHKRLNHRSTATSSTSGNVAANGSGVKKPEPEVTPPTTCKPKQEETTKHSSSNAVLPATGHAHGTRYSKTRNGSNRDEEMSLGKGRHLTCASCGHNFDSKDPVVLHLLRQSRSENGTIKCPFCAKMLLDGGSTLLSPEGSSAENNVSDVTTTLKAATGQIKSNPSPPPARVNLSLRRRSREGKPINENKSASSINDAAVPNKKRKNQTTTGPKASSTPIISPRESSRRIKKRKLSVPSDSSVDSLISTGRNENSSDNHSATPSAALNTPKRSVTFSKKSKITTFEAASPILPVQQDQFKHKFEITYRQPRGKGSRGGIGGRRNSLLDRRNSVNRDEDSRNSVDAPLKVSVLINNNPYPSATRLAVPKGKHFEKGDIRCPYCGFEAKSVREVQFHVNTHMAKSYPCEFCSHIYRSKQAVMKHTEKYHPDQVSKIQASGINDSRDEGKQQIDQRSMSNYSSSMTSDYPDTEGYFNYASQSQEDSNLENSNVTATGTSYYASEFQNSSFYLDQANSGSNNTSAGGEHREYLVMGERVGTTAVEKVVEIANF